MTTLNKTLDELKFEFSGIGGILHDAFSVEGNKLSSIKNSSNKNSRKRRYDNIKGANGVDTMTDKFKEAENELLKKSSAQIISAPTGGANDPLTKYQNNLPYGVSAAGGVNEELYAVNENVWAQFSKDMGKIFQKVGKQDQLYKASFNAMTSANSHLKGQDIENMVYSTCGSLSEWPQINPKSAGFGKCSKLFDVFANHYKRYNGKIDESKFYSDLMSSLHTCEIFALSRGITGKRNTTGIQNFSSEVKVYNIDTSLWFPSDEEIKEAEYNGFAKTGKDSYGIFFDIDGFPVSKERYQSVYQELENPLYNGKLRKAVYTIVNNEIRSNNFKKANGTYMTISDPAAVTHIFYIRNIVIMNNIEINDTAKYPQNKIVKKKYCSLFLHEGDETDIEKIVDIENIAGYLFNTRKAGIFPAICILESVTRPGLARCVKRKNDIILTQRRPEIGVMLFLRKIFEEIYPIIRRDPSVGVGQYNRPINIFNADNAIVVGGGGAENLDDYNSPAASPQSIMDHATDSLNDVKTKLIRKIDNYMSGISMANYTSTYIKDLKDMINSIDATNLISIPDPDPTAGAGATVNPTSFDILFFHQSYIGAGLINLFSQALGNFNFSAGNLNFFLNGDALRVGNNKPSVQVYRHLMYRLIWKCWNEHHAVANNLANKYNLYMDSAAADTNLVTLTQARAQGGGYNDLTNFKQAIQDINPIMVGGNRKSSHNNLIKTGGKKSKIIQKGGASDRLFTTNNVAGNPEGIPKLYANRKLMNFNASQYELAVKKYKDLGFTADYAKVKSLFDKISQISHLPLFFDGYKDTLNIFTNDGQAAGGGAAAPESGGCGVVPPAGNTIPLSFPDVAQLFLFNSVNTTTTTLLIHFLKNVKACLNHFITTDLKVANDTFSKQITGGTQSDKVEGSLRELIKEIDKVVNFLKYNTLNLQEQSVRLNNDDGRVNPAQKFQNNEHYIKNLFLGANVFFSHDDAPNKSVVMRFTTNDGGDAGGGNIINWHGDEFFQFLNRIIGCTETSGAFGNTLKFLTDSNNPVNQALQVYQTTPAMALTAGNNPYLEKIRPYLKDKPDGCFGGIPFVSLDPTIFSLLTQSFYLLLGLRLEVGVDVQANDRIEKEIEFSKLAQDKKDGVRTRIQDTLSSATFSTLAESLKTQATIDKANMMFNTIFRFLFIESRRLIAQVNQAKQEINKAAKVGNKKNSKKGLFTGGGPASIYTFRKTTNSNQQANLIKSEVNFIKTTYQVSAEFDYIIDQILIQMKKEIERRGVKNELHFFYYMDTHFRNFQIYMNTYLLTIGENNIPPEIAKKLQDYISYSPDKNKALESYKKLTEIPLTDPRYSDPLWWANIERKFMDIQKIDGPSQNDCVYRLFIITTTPPSIGKLRDMYIIDAFSLATLNTGRSSDKYWCSSTGDRTHLDIRKTKDANGDKIYLDTNTIIKLTGAGSGTTRNTIKERITTPFRTKNINIQIRIAIKEDIRDLICGKFKYYDRSTNSLKTLIPLFLQANRNDVLKNIVNRQKNDMFQDFRTKFKLGTTVDYRIYQISDDYIKDLKKYRQWLYQIFIEKQMKLTKPEVDTFDSIEKTMISSFSGKFFSSNVSGKCSRIYNIYDYIVLQSSNASENATTKSKKMANFRNPTDHSKKHPTHSPDPIQEQKIRYPDPNFSTADFGAEMIAGFISRESLIKLMLIY